MTTQVKAVIGVVLAAVIALAAHSWLAEHDARMKADMAVQQAQTQIVTLEQQQVDAERAAKAQKAALARQAAAVKTPAQAIQAIPSVSDVPLNVRQAPGLPDAVAVDAVPLFQELNKCKQTAVDLAACSTKLDLQQKIDAEKDQQIEALKHKSGFWSRVKSTAVTVGIGVAAGYALHR